MTGRLRLDDPARRSLPFANWPEADRLAWEAALASGDLLDGTVGPAHHWREKTRAKNARGYGRWLTFLLRAGLLSAGATPGARVSRDNVRAYIAELESQEVSSWTLWARLVELYSAIRVMAPADGFAWLWRAARVYQRRRVGTRNKLARLHTPHEILDWSLRRMDQLRSCLPQPDTAGSHRDALMIGLLCSCPIRLHNLAMIVLGRHLVRTGQGYVLRFAAEETKSHRPIAMPLPTSLTDPIDHYLAVIRPHLLGGRESDHLWIGRHGTALQRRSMQDAIARTSQRAFGRSINPHLFRGCAATFVALEDPEHIGIVPPLLGHMHMETAESHYIQARQIVAARRIRSSLATLRKRLGAQHSGRPT